MKKIICTVAVMLFISGNSAFAEIKEVEKDRGGAGLQNVYDRVLCVDGHKVFQTIAFGFKGEGGAAVSTIQLMEEKDGKLVPVKCSE
jgi:hypothetical protein